MKINRLLADQYKIGDLLDNGEEKYKLDMCPVSIRKIAENILGIIDSVYWDYNTMSKLDKIIMVNYWQKCDNQPSVNDAENWLEWFVNKATLPEDIRRARQWLLEKNFIVVKSDVAQRAQEAGTKRARSF
jgi:hypothetical protein